MATNNVIQTVVESAQRHAYALTQKAAIVELVLAPTIANLPEDLIEYLPTTAYGYYIYEHSQTVEIDFNMELDTDQSFVKRMQPLVRFFHVLNIKNRKRHLREYNGDCMYSGDTVLSNGWRLKLEITVPGEAGLPPTCHLEKVVTTETITQTRYKSVCVNPETGEVTTSARS